jgi:hypothetical protein
MGIKRTIVVVAFVILVAIFIFMIFYMKEVDKDVVFPPVVSRCPDYWDHDISGDGDGDGVCKNTFGMKKGGDTIPDNDFSGFDIGSGGKCSKKEWAIENNLTWDGITNDMMVDCSGY